MTQSYKLAMRSRNISTFCINVWYSVYFVQGQIYNCTLRMGKVAWDCSTEMLFLSPIQCWKTIEINERNSSTNLSHRKSPTGCSILSL